MDVQNQQIQLPALKDAFVEASRLVAPIGVWPSHELRGPVLEDFALMELADKFNSAVRDMGLSPKQNLSQIDLAKSIARYNGLLPEGMSEESLSDFKFTTGQVISIPLPNGLKFVQDPQTGHINIIENDFTKTGSLNDPANPHWAGQAYLAVVEMGLLAGKETDQHHVQVFENATHYAQALNPEIDRSHIFALRGNLFDKDPAMLNMLASDAIKSGALIISNSEAWGIDQTPFGGIHEFLVADINPTYFGAAGNEFELDSDYSGASTLVFSGRSYLIGAAHEANGIPYIGEYSNAGADILGPPIPTFNGGEQAGTSISTPLMAALNRQMVEWYGGVLSQEEIMAAAYMSTDMELYHKNQKDNRWPKAEFHTNAGGRPHHDQAGAGMIDAHRWQDNLDKMARMKDNMDYVPEEVAPLTYTFEDYKPFVTLNAYGQPTYHYDLAVTADMTLDRINISAPTITGKIADLAISSPSGFHVDLPRSAVQAYGTSALALEDVREGDVITLSSSEPLDPHAAVIIRGHADGNVVQMLRDHLQEHGLMPEPLSHYEGATLAANIPTPTPRPVEGDMAAQDPIAEMIRRDRNAAPMDAPGL